MSNIILENSEPNYEQVQRAKNSPLLINNKFLINAKEKANEFVKYFSSQCTPLINNSSIPNMAYLTEQRLRSIPITNDDILSLIRGINKNKANDPDEVSARMLSICDESIILPLKLIFTNIVSTGIYPHIWKQANVTPIHKKGSKQIISNYHPISLLPICSKLFERIVFKYLYNYLARRLVI